ncbi:hypothetical protein ACLB2K_026822 [Fragaria x ananassa]
MPHLSDPKVIAAMTCVVSDVSQTRSVNALSPWPPPRPRGRRHRQGQARPYRLFSLQEARGPRPLPTPKLLLLTRSTAAKLCWFQDTLKEAKGDDTVMQVLVGQIYHTGYGVEKNPEKGHAWISRASRSRRAVWKVSQKQPGYHASDSDSDELEDVAK